MRETRQSGSEGGRSEANRLSLPLYSHSVRFADEKHFRGFAFANLNRLSPRGIICGLRLDDRVDFFLGDLLPWLLLSCSHNSWCKPMPVNHCPILQS